MGLMRYVRRRWWDDERARELQSHLEIEIDENIAQGLSPDEARWAAHRKLGSVARIREEIYEMNTFAVVETIWQDLRYGARLLRRNPAFTVIALLSLMLGIGANTAIFQLLDAVRLRALPVREPSQLVEVRIAEGTRRPGNFISRYAELTNPQWDRLQAEQRAFSGMLAWSPARFNLARGGEVRYAQGIYVSGSFFEMLGVPAARGRLLGAADDRRGCSASTAVISHAFWQREYGGDPTIVGRTIHLEDRAFDIVGVTPAGFYGVEVGRMFDVAVPVCAAPALGGEPGLLDDGFTWWLSVLGRLRPGWSVERATAHLRAISPGAVLGDGVEPARPRTGEGVSRVQAGSDPAGRRVRRCAPSTRRRSGCSWACRRWCCSPRVPTWRTCCWREPAPARARWPCGWLRARPADGSSASCCPRACCWPCSAPRSGPSWPGSSAPSRSRS